MTMTRTASALAATLLAAATLVASTAHAQVLLQPVVLELQPRQKVVAVTVTLSEKAPAPIRLQAELLRWTQDEQGRPLTRASDDLLVSPPIADLQPGQRQVFRLAMRHPKALAEEAAYRLVLEDIAPAPSDESGQPRAGLHIRMRYDLPVMVAPVAKAAQALQWKPCEPRASASVVAEACVRVRNGGNTRIKLQALHMGGDGWRQTIDIAEGALVLAGAEREWRAPLQAGHRGPLRDLQVQTSRGQSLLAEPRAF